MDDTQNKEAEEMEELRAPYPWARYQAPSLDIEDFYAVHLVTTGQLFGEKTAGQG